MRIDFNEILKWIFFVIMMSIVSFWVLGCSSNHHLKRSAYHLERAKAKGYVSQVDTVYIQDSTITERVHRDTLFIDVGDTVILKKDRLKVIYRRDTITNEVFISGICEADTIIKEVPFMVQETVYIERGIFDIIGIDKTWEKIVFWIMFSLASIILVALIVYRFVLK